MDNNHGRRLILNERIHIVKMYYETRSFKEINDNWGDSFQTRPPTKRSCQQLIKKFEETGSVTDAPRSGAPKTVNTIENRELVATAYVASPKKSQRKATHELQISRRSLNRIMTEIGLTPYRPRLLQGLLEDDSDRRVQFCEEFLSLYHINPDILDKVIWTDEASFKLNGRINRHNSVYWSLENPHEILTKEVNAPGITVWGGLTSNGLIGPFFFDGTVNALNYEEMLQTKLWPMFEHHHDVQNLFFQQDGAPPHYGNNVRKWLDVHFPKRWIGRRGSIDWPARSPDLSPPDFFLWGVLKDKVFSHKPPTIAALKNAIEIEWQTISPQLCHKVAHSVIHRLEDCLKAEGSHFEHLYN